MTAVENRNQMVEQYLRLVTKIARSMKTPSVDFDDLVQDGRLGLLRAAELFDPHRGIQFTTFAYPRICGAIIDARRELDVLSRGDRGRGIGVEIKTLSISQQVPVGGTSRKMLIGDSVAAKQGTDDQYGRIKDIVSVVSSAHAREIMMAIFYEGKSQTEIATLRGVSRSRVCQIVTAAIEEIRGQMGVSKRQPTDQNACQVLKNGIISFRVRDLIAAGLDCNSRAEIQCDPQKRTMAVQAASANRPSAKKFVVATAKTVKVCVQKELSMLGRRRGKILLDGFYPASVVGDRLVVDFKSKLAGTGATQTVGIG